MRKCLAAVALVVFASVAHAQPAIFDGSRGSFPGCPTCGVWSWVDLPAPEVTVHASDFTVQGWGFECMSGNPIDRVEVFYQDYNGWWHPLYQGPTALMWGASARPDVRAAFGAGCPLMGDYTGWTLILTNPPPLGLRRVQFTIWRGPYYEAHRRTYLIVP
jgi:hypothetical protein